MNFRKWLSRQVSSKSAGGRCWISSLLNRLGGCKGGTCGGTQQRTNPAAGTGNWFQRLLAKRGNGMSATNTQAARLLDEVMTRLGQVMHDCAGQAAQGQAGADNPADIGSQTGAAGQLLPDAIDREIAASARQTAVTKLRQSDVVEQFRRELETQSLTVTTVTAFLQMLQQVLPLLLTR